MPLILEMVGYLVYLFNMLVLLFDQVVFNAMNFRILHITIIEYSLYYLWPSVQCPDKFYYLISPMPNFIIAALLLELVFSIKVNHHDQNSAAKKVVWDQFEAPTSARGTYYN